MMVSWGNVCMFMYKNVSKGREGGRKNEWIGVEDSVRMNEMMIT